MIDLIGIYESAGRDSAENGALHRADRLFPNRADLLFNLGTVMLRLHHPDSAEVYLDRVSHLVPENATVLTALARAKEGVGKKQEAADLRAKVAKSLTLTRNEAPDRDSSDAVFLLTLGLRIGPPVLLLLLAIEYYFWGGRAVWFVIPDIAAAALATLFASWLIGKFG